MVLNAAPGDGIAPVLGAGCQIIVGSEVPANQVFGATSKYFQFVVHIVPVAPA